MTSEPATRRKRRSPEELRGLILAAAASEFEANTYAGATTAAIAKRAQTTEAQIFRMFPSKAELFRKAVFEGLNRHFDEFFAQNAAAAASGPPSHRESSERYIEELQAFLGDHARMLLSLLAAGFREPGSQEMLDGMQAYFARGGALMRARMTGEPRIPVDLMVRVSFAAVLGNVLFHDLVFPPGVFEETAVRRAMVDFMIEGLQANAPEHGEMG